MRAANNGAGPSGRTGGVREAVEALKSTRVRSLAESVETYDVLEHPGPRLGAQRALPPPRGRRAASRAERIGELARLPQRDELAVAALLHDVGQLVLARALRRRDLESTRATRRPTSALRRERRELGIDHALVGAVLVRRWGLPPIIAARGRAPPRAGRRPATRRRSGSPT